MQVTAQALHVWKACCIADGGWGLGPGMVCHWWKSLCIPASVCVLLVLCLLAALRDDGVTE